MTTGGAVPTNPQETTVRPRVLARLAVLLSVVLPALLGGGVALAATPVVTVTVGQVRQLVPLCPVAWSLTDDDPRLPVGVGRAVAVGTCIQHLGEITRLSRTATTPPPPDAPVPPGADGRPVAPFVVRIVTRFSAPEPTPAPAPTPALQPPPRPAPAPAPVRSPAVAPAVAPAAPGIPTAPAAPATRPEVGAATDPSAPPADVTVDAAAGAVAADPLFPPPGPPATPAAKASIRGLPGTVSDPAVLAAEVAAATGTSTPVLLLGTVAVVVIAGLLLGWALGGRDLLPRLRGVLSRGGPEEARPTVDEDEIAPPDLVDRWLHAGEETAVPSPRDPLEQTTGPAARVSDVVV